MMLPLEEVPVMSRFSVPLSSRVLTFVLCVAICGISTWSAERVVDLTAGDGMKLKATYFAAAKPGPGVLLLHQCNRQRKIWDVLAQQLAAAGINVLTLDYRGYGESGGDRFDKLPPQEAAQVQTEKWPGDIDTAFQYLASQPGVMRGMIGVGGASCGVNNSIQTARRHPEVKSLALLSGSTDLKGLNSCGSPQSCRCFSRWPMTTNSRFRSWPSSGSTVSRLTRIRSLFMLRRVDTERTCLRCIRICLGKS
jgi:pimeloyl-ACP methyl ester carboxylesterase